MFCDVINDVSLMSHTSSGSPWSELPNLRQTKWGDHVGTLESKINKNLKMALQRHLVEILMAYALKDRKLLLNPNLNISWPIEGHQRSNVGQTRHIGVKSGRLVEICQIYIYFDSEFCQGLKFKIIWGQIKKHQIGLFGPIEYNIHMVWLRILSWLCLDSKAIFLVETSRLIYIWLHVATEKERNCNIM